MPIIRLRSIVPMFGGRMRYVETLTQILEFVEAHQPITDELVDLLGVQFAVGQESRNVFGREQSVRLERPLADSLPF